jgi:quinol-cytochrome oxidoreductase complex cytochrome b subunit
MKGDRILLSVIGLGVFAAVVALAFTGYVSPAMLIDFANIRICS